MLAQITEHPILEPIWETMAYIAAAELAMWITGGLLVGLGVYWLWQRQRRPGWAAVAIGAVLILLLLSSCSLLGRAMEHGGQLLDSRSAKKQSGWSWEGFLTCDEGPKIHPDLTGEADRWCVRTLAPTLQDCAAGNGLPFWFGDSLSGVSRQVLYDLCRGSEFGERWNHLDGVYESGKLVVRDANRGSKPL